MRRDAGIGGETLRGELDEAMDRYAAGDDRMFAALYDGLTPMLERYLTGRLRERSLVEDVVQQTFLHMHEKRGSFRRGSLVTPWAFCIARNLMIDILRRMRRNPSAEVRIVEGVVDQELLITYAGTGEEAVIAHETRARLVAAYASLSERQRTAFELTKDHGLSQAEAAQILGTTVMAVKQSVHKALVKLRGAVEQSDVPDAPLAIAVQSSGAVDG
jgi:RNA polymerase sigma factor (sigma-70 family)